MEPVSILLVEDNQSGSESVSSKFDNSRLAAAITVANGSQEGGEILKNPKGGKCPDLLLLDLHVPAKEIKLHLDSMLLESACKTIPVVVFVDSDIDEEILRLEGVTYYFLRRPFEIQKLLDIIFATGKFKLVITKA